MATVFIAIAGFDIVKVSVAVYTFYIDDGGNDITGNGSLNSPWATIGKAGDYMVKKAEA